MKQNWKTLVVFAVIILLMGLFAFLSWYHRKIPSNDISVTGNTAGNLNNGGLFTEVDGKVYFSNAYDNGCLYSMNSNETELKKLSASRANSINADSHHIYFYMDSLNSGTGFGRVVRTRGVYRMDPNGKNTTCLDGEAAVTIQLVGDYLYYQRYNNTDFTKLYKVRTDNSGLQLVSDEIINPAACNNGIIYYNGTGQDHYLYGLDTRTDTSFTAFEGNLWYPVYHNNYIYYMDVGNNYHLCRIPLSGGSPEVLTTDRVDAYNVGDSYIYYQRNSSTEPALMRMGLDGSAPEMVAAGNYSNLNLTSTYAYFTEFGAELPVYHTPVNGPINVSVFTAAQEAAFAPTK